MLGRIKRPHNKIGEKLRHERFDTVYSSDWRSVCHFDVVLMGNRVPLSCKTATQISNPDTIAIRTSGVPEGSAVIREPDSRNRIGPNRCFHPAQYNGSVVNADATTIYFLCFLFLFSQFVLTSPVRQQLRFSSGPLNFRLFFELNRRVKSAKNN